MSLRKVRSHAAEAPAARAAVSRAIANMVVDCLGSLWVAYRGDVV